MILIASPADTSDGTLKQTFLVSGWAPSELPLERPLDLGFFDGPESKLEKVDVQGGAVQTLSDVPSDNPGRNVEQGRCDPFGTSATGAIRRVSSNGGVPVQVTTLDASPQETAHPWPYFLPDGRHFL